MSKPTLVALARIRVMEVQPPVQSWFCATPMPENKKEYLMSLGKTNKKRVAFTTLCDVSARTLADAIRNYIEKEELVEAVLCLDLSANPNMSCESLGRILEVLMEFQIWALDLSSNLQLGDSIVAAIQPLLETKKLHLFDLKLSRCGLTVAGLKWLVQVASKSRLRLLDISYIRISDESELIEQVLELPMIEELAFRFCDLSLSDVRTIAESLPFTGVKSLHLAGNTLGSQGLVHLASKLPESMVEELDLAKVGIEANCEGLSELTKALVKRPFPKLYLKNNPMGHAEVINFITVLRSLTPCDPEVEDTWMGNAPMKCC